MSIIHETLDNLKQGKKSDESPSLDPSSSSFIEQSSTKKPKIKEKPIKIKQDYTFISMASLFALVLIFFFVYRFNSASPSNPSRASAQRLQQSHSALQSQALQSKAKPNHLALKPNAPAQNEYYRALTLANNGQVAEALSLWKEINQQYPDFEPAKKSYSLLMDR